MAEDDLYYRPIAGELGFESQQQLARVLVVGSPEEGVRAQLEALTAEVRETVPTAAEVGLHKGCYSVYRRGEWHGLLVVDGQAETHPAGARHQFTDDGPRRHLGLARLALAEAWEDARPLLGASAFAINDMVRIAGVDAPGRVRRVTATPAGYRIEVAIDGEIRHVGEASIERIDGDPRDPKFWLEQGPAPAADIALTLTWTKLRKPLSNVLYSFQASKTIFRAYQFIPALKMLNSPTGRLLIADEVGLGKTIEAGIVWCELEQRSPLRRTLVVVPSSLTLKWQREMRRRFDRQLEVIRPRELDVLADQLLDGADPEFHAIVSLESLRTATETLERLTRIPPRFDLVIVDEAHALRNVGTRSNLLGALLSDWADHLLFLSATPINLRSEDLYNLLTLLDDGMFPDVDVFRQQLEPNQHLNAISRLIAQRADVSAARTELDAVARTTFGKTISARPDFGRLKALLGGTLNLNDAERSEIKGLVAELNTLSTVLSRTRKVDVPDAKAIREVHEVRVDWSGAEKDYYDSVVGYYMARALAAGTPPGFAMQMPLRQAASCLAATQETLRTRDASLFRNSIDDSDEDPEEVAFEELNDIPVLARPLGRDSKFEALLEKLVDLRRQGIRQAMIFSTFRGTISYLMERLGAADFDVRAMHGGVKMEERQPIIDDFRAGVFDILVVSEVGSEGLDFEFCNVLVNYDLPWNPMRVEQRIGRLDRFGQQHEKILIINMHVPGTIESDIIARLYTRIGIFQDSIGDLEPILRDEFRDVATRLLDPRLTPEQRARRADEIALAIETRSAQIKKLETERATLTTIDQLKIDGMTESGPADGRYVGASEIESIMDRLMRATGATLGPARRKGVWVLRGNSELAERFFQVRRRERKADRGSKYPVAALEAKLRAGEPLEVTFDAELASRHDVELLSARHPLVDVALASLESDDLHLRRFGRVAVPDIDAGRRFAVQIDLVETTGIRPSRELVATAIDVGTGEVSDVVGSAVLTALAEGTLVDAPGAPWTGVERLHRQLESSAWARLAPEEERRRLDNDALVAGRTQSRREALLIKERRALASLATVRADGRDPRVIRMNEGRLRNIRAELDSLQATVVAHREMSMSVQTVALLDVVGA
ncbi:helicase-related protein [Cellulomonas fimi]|uniref:DEAD/DEAH box helicase family protein n=1 Tax=Cellulomonas fimi TaxID=1708 RepID=A0A7Y0M083_CELFI|nr:helicase-related protein [Cellulomonas fimi]NMR21144.1 DEAD/DEAH box helicase family protein [Cellulomonas fimi]